MRMTMYCKNEENALQKDTLDNNFFRISKHLHPLNGLDDLHPLVQAQ
jgi:hypothetical protein